MEERIIDREREIKIKRTKEGDTDALGGGAEDGAIEEEEIVLELPDEDYDEDLVGLTPSQLKAELERRKKAEEEARLECAKLVKEGNGALAARKYAEAEGFFAQALVYDMESKEAHRGLWAARTRDFSDGEALITEENATALSEESDETRAHVLGRLGDYFKGELISSEKEEAELAPRVEEAQSERRVAFQANRKYYLARFVAVSAVMVLFIIGAIVSASFIYTTTGIAPVVCTAVFAGCAAVMLGVLCVFTRKLLVATRLCRANERLSSTKEGARLAFLRTRLENLHLILGE